MNEPDFRMTRHQVPRSALPDARIGNDLVLLKNVSSLGATYQIRLLVYQAAKSGGRLIVQVPNHCRLQPTLLALIGEAGRLLKIERV